jgi:flagellar basal body rod protein FlgG
MKARTIVLIAALWFIGVGVCFAQNPFMGTWKLNEAKSTLAPGMPKNDKVVYEPDGLDVKVTIDGTNTTGNPTHNEWMGKFDGKYYPVKGDPNSDSRSYTRKGIHELDFTVKNGTMVTTAGRIVVSDDGKSRTVTSSGTDAQGKKFTSTGVYDKQ